MNNRASTHFDLFEKANLIKDDHPEIRQLVDQYRLFHQWRCPYDYCHYYHNLNHNLIFHLKETKAHKHEKDLEEHINKLLNIKNRYELLNEYFFENETKKEEIKEKLKSSFVEKVHFKQ